MTNIHKIIFLTELETQIVESFDVAFNCTNAEDEKSDNATALTVDDIVKITGLPMMTVRGVFASLHKKGLLVEWGEPDMEGVSNITDVGIDAYYEIKNDLMSA